MANKLITKSTFNGTEFKIYSSTLDQRLTSTKVLVASVLSTLAFASSQITLMKSVSVVLSDQSSFYGLSGSEWVKAHGSFDGKKTVTVTTQHDAARIQIIIFHELGHVAHETATPGSTASWAELRKETYAQNVARTLNAAA